ncbi:MAG: hypothetical protein HDS72_02900 [Bacteroidales bacterium]|nr:hypothetical protein [Bacteroidales bacterium]
MNKSFFLPLLIATLAASCSQYDESALKEVDEGDFPSADQLQIVQITEDVNNVEVNNILSSLFGNQKSSRSNDLDIKVIKDDDGKDCIIRVNYTDGNGFALISATKTHEPILAYSSENSFGDQIDLPFPLNDWFASTIEDISESYNLPEDSLVQVTNAWRLYEAKGSNVLSRDGYDSDHSYLRRLSQQDVDRLTAIAMDSISYWRKQGYRVYPIDNLESLQDFPDRESIAQFMMGILYPDYAEDYFAISYVVEKDIKKTYGAGHCMKTTWDQESGYNQAFPMKTDGSGQRIPVGCAPVALGQIMYFYKYPTFFNWTAMGAIYATATTSNFLLDVFTKCKTKYNATDDSSGTTYDNLEAAIKSYGYNYNRVKASEIDFASLMYGSPAILCSEWENGKLHAWVVEGVTYTEEYTETQVFSFVQKDKFQSVYFQTTIPPTTSSRIYINWGWNGTYNGFYSINRMIPGNHSKSTLKCGFINFKKQ